MVIPDRNGDAFKSWLKSHWKQVMAHGLILGGFVLYCIFLAGPLSDKLEGIQGESRLQDIKLPAVTNNIQYSIISENNTYTIDLTGWAFIKGEDYKDCQTYIILKSDRKTYVFDTLQAYRPRITSTYKSLNLNLDWAGFWAYIPLRKIEAGKYNIGVYIKKGNIEALQYTWKYVTR